MRIGNHVINSLHVYENLFLMDINLRWKSALDMSYFVILKSFVCDIVCDFFT